MFFSISQQKELNITQIQNILKIIKVKYKVVKD